ncbi:type I glyceraldehyde-3-phosphate dehydrogenase, partial [Candidatus Riflebacteria bacterium]
AVKVGINGFGRIGRLVYRASLATDKVDVVAINDLGDAKTMAHLLKFDSVHENLKQDVSVKDGNIHCGDDVLKVFSVRNPSEIDWSSEGVDVVVECTGLFRKTEDAGVHLKGSVKKVIISAPAKGPMPTFVMGVNEESYNPETDHVVSNASCTTNCLAPVTKVLHEAFNIEFGMMTTIHSYTNDQKILDLPHSDLRRARAAALSMIPTTTGAAKAVGLVLPDLKGKVDGMAIRVPTPNVSLVDAVFTVSKEVTKEAVNEKLKAAAEGSKFLAFSELPLVSKDYNGNPYSSTVDGLSTIVIGKMVKVTAWYDNEWGYSMRVIDLIEYMIEKGL